MDTSCSAINTCRTCDHSGNCYAVEIFPNASIAEYGTYSYFTGGFGAVADKIKAEIYARGPVATGVNAEPLLDYAGGVVDDTKFWRMTVNHVVSIVGWDTDPGTGEQYWIVRNSWYVCCGAVSCFPNRRGTYACSFDSILSNVDRGEYWGNMVCLAVVDAVTLIDLSVLTRRLFCVFEQGFFSIVMGKNSLGIETEVAWATPGSFTVKNFPCNEDGSNCHRHGEGMEAHVYQDPSENPKTIKEKRHLQA